MTIDECPQGEASSAVADLAGLDHAIRNLAASVRSDVDSRLHHPKYGVTKRDAFDALARLEGALVARAAVMGESTASYLLAARTQAEALAIPLDALRRAVAGC